MNIDRKVVEQALESLKQAKDALADWGGYVSDYFKQKHDLQGDLDAIQSQITALLAALGAKQPAGEPCKYCGETSDHDTRYCYTAPHPAKAEQPAGEQDSTCSETLRSQGKAYPRTCKKCGLGPCVGKPLQPAGEPVADEQGRRIYDAATHAAAMAVFMTRMDAEQPDADDMGVSGWLQEAEDRVKRRATQSLKSLIYSAPQPAKQPTLNGDKEMAEIQYIYDEYKKPDSQVGKGNLYWALGKCLMRLKAQSATEYDEPVCDKCGDVLVNSKLDGALCCDCAYSPPPFEPLVNTVPSATTTQAMQDARAGKVTKAANLDALFASMHDEGQLKPLVIYHAQCTDGFGAAFAAWMKLGDDAEYVPMMYGKDLAVDPRDRDVYVLDFSFPLQTTNWLISHARRFIWLDHHKTAFEMWCPDEANRWTSDPNDKKQHILLDNNKSGALLAWEYFHPGTEVPRLISRIDDRDRWVFQYDDSHALHAGLSSVGFDFERWKFLTPQGTSDWGRNYHDVVSRGNTILSAYNEQVKDRVRAAGECRIVPALIESAASYKAPWTWVGGQCGASGLAVNSPMHQSEIGCELAKACGTYGLVWYYDAEAKRAYVSLRSIGDYDVSAIAKAFGGGGHKNAAGFNIDMPTLLGWMHS